MPLLMSLSRCRFAVGLGGAAKLQLLGCTPYCYCPADRSFQLSFLSCSNTAGLVHDFPGFSIGDDGMRYRFVN
jgi:hypothetical protein